MARREDRDRRRSRGLDPLARARNLPVMPSPRLDVINVPRRIQRVQTLADLALALALRQPGASPVEVLNALPEPTSTDLGRQILVRLPGETVSAIYMGLLGADDIVFWQRLAQGTSGGGSSSPEYTFVGHVTNFDQVAGVYATSSEFVCIALDNSSSWRYTRSSGLISVISPSDGAGSSILRDGSGNYYIAKPASNLVRKRTTGGTVTNTSASHTYNAIAHRLGTANLFATATDSNAFYKLDMGTMAITNTVTGLNSPQGIAVDSLDNIYVANGGTNKIRKYNSSLTFVTEFPSVTGGSADGQLNTPKGLAFDASDRLYVVDSGNDRVQVFDTSGTFLGKLGSSGSGLGQLSGPIGVAVSSTSIIISDTGNERLSEWLRAS